MVDGRYWDVKYDADGPICANSVGFARVYAPPHFASTNGVHGTVVVIHGGYWKNQYTLENAGTTSVAPFFLAHGFAAIDLEYRRRDHPGGGWPGTNKDIIAGLQRLLDIQSGSASDVENLDAEGMRAVQALRLDKIILIGHSAGGQLALWAGHELAKQNRTNLTGLKVALVSAMAPVADLIKGYEMKISSEGDAVERYMGQAPDTELARIQYLNASPAALLPVCFPLLLVYGDADDDVPPCLIESYAQAAKASTSAGLMSVVRIAGADHFDVMNAQSGAWKNEIIPAMAEQISRSLGAAAAAALESKTVSMELAGVESKAVATEPEPKHTAKGNSEGLDEEIGKLSNKLDYLAKQNENMAMKDEALGG